MRRRRILVLAAAVVAPALVLAALSWRSLRQERDERRGEIATLADASARSLVRDLDLELKEVRGRGFTPAVRASEVLAPAGLSLEERVRRESPELLGPLADAEDLELAPGRASEASDRYARLAGQVESPATRAGLLHARARAALRGGRADAARPVLEELARESGLVSGESGIPYGLLARARLAALEPSPEKVEAFVRTLEASGLPGHARALLLRDLMEHARLPREPLRRALAEARGLEAVEEALSHGDAPRDDFRVFEGLPYVLAFADGGGAALALGEFPRTPPPRLAGVAFEIEGIPPTPAGEVLARRTSAAHPSLAVAARLSDPSRLEPAPARVALTAGLVACLLAALLLGIGGMLRTVRQELAVAQLKSDIVSGVSHELKTPLTSIRMFAEMLEGGRVADEGKKREYHRLIHRESVRLSRLVENVLDFARIEEGRKTFTFQERPLNDAVRSAADAFRAQVDGQDLRLRAEIPAEPIVARIDADALVGAVLNLLDNAAKYGGSPREVELRLARRGDRAEVSVGDNGPGIAPGERGRIFDRFYRGAAARSGPAGGAGLGLTIVRHAIEAHGGSVSVESEVGKGSRFILTLPCRESPS